MNVAGVYPSVSKNVVPFVNSKKREILKIY
uniref:Uncharacterized protein n=1 Tax=Anguilla anguilla TaxID=7936 RepID=A0A0E9RGD7_ANGAN